MFWCLLERIHRLKISQEGVHEKGREDSCGSLWIFAYFMPIIRNHIWVNKLTGLKLLTYCVPFLKKYWNMVQLFTFWFLIYLSHCCFAVRRHHDKENLYKINHTKLGGSLQFQRVCLQLQRVRSLAVGKHGAGSETECLYSYPRLYAERERDWAWHAFLKPQIPL